ncbi:MAG TPA: hypothetical protein QGF58_12360 [Myxococcota bacterium]|nr:hypothetical protein [Myxococcota bacterium]
MLLPEHFRSAKALGVSRQWLYRLLARWEGTESPPFPAALGLEPLSVLGRGSMGWVFRARDPLLERDVAVKIARPDRGEQARDARLLEGGGRLSLSCQVPALARLHRFELRQRRLVPVEVHSLEMPLTRLELEPGPWLIEVGAEGYTTVRYSLALRRQQHHRGEVRLFRPEQVGDGFVHMPASPFHMGGDPVARMLGWRVGGRGPLRSFVVSGDPLARGALESCEPTLGDRFVQETPVTSAAWREFLDDLPLDEARSLVPGEAGLHGKLLPYWEHDGSRWILPEDWDPHWPVMGVSLADEDDLRLASRSGLDPNFRSSFVGFRLVSEEPAPSPSAPMADRA